MGTSRTSTVTTAGALACSPSLMTSWKANSVLAETSGAAKLAWEEAAPLRVTGGPPTCVHAKTSRASSSGSEPVPVSVTLAPSFTGATVSTWATGGRLPLEMFRTRTVTSEGRLVFTPSCTRSSKRRFVSSVTSGARKVGLCALALLSATAGPWVCVHA